MADRQSGSVWTHLEGKAIQGTSTGTTMAIILLLHTTWGEWLKLHPDTTVLDPNTPFAAQYRPVTIGMSGLGPGFVQSLLSWDPRLPDGTIVVGVTSGDVSQAYALDILVEGLGAVNDILGELPIVVFHDKAKAFGIAYSRVLDGDTLTFSATGGRIVDDETGTTWNQEGVAVDGPLAGQRLEFVTSFITEWYGWAAFHPSTGIYKEAETQALLGTGSAEPSARGDSFGGFGGGRR